MVSIEGTVEQRVYQGVNTQVTVSLGNGARLVALEQNTYRARSDDRWEPGTKVRSAGTPTTASSCAEPLIKARRSPRPGSGRRPSR